MSNNHNGRNTAKHMVTGEYHCQLCKDKKHLDYYHMWLIDKHAHTNDKNCIWFLGLIDYDNGKGPVEDIHIVLCEDCLDKLAEIFTNIRWCECGCGG